MKTLNITVIGAGIMGTGIAEAFAEAGYPVCLYARRQQRLDSALARIESNQNVLSDCGLLDEGVKAAADERLRTSTDLDEALKGAQFVSENIPEDLTLKQELFAEIEARVDAEVIFGSNTSSIPITQIAAGLSHPERVLGFHWFNPPHLMRPVEIVRGERTSDAVMDTVCDLVRGLSRFPVRVERDVPGFLWNRLQMALIREAVHLMDEGIARPEDIDLAVQWGLGFRWAALGPLRVMDLAGLGTLGAVAGIINSHLCADVGVQRSVQEKIERGALGAQAGEGFYSYDPGEPERFIRARDEKLIALLQTLGADRNGAPNE